jgi:hypothetical protein
MLLVIMSIPVLGVNHRRPQHSPYTAAAAKRGVKALQQSIYTAGTNNQYTRAWNCFRSFCASNSIYILHENCLDGALCDFIGYSYDSGMYPHSVCSCAVFAVQSKFPNLKYSLNTSKLLLRGWNRVRIVQTKVPITRELLTVVAVAMARDGLHTAAIATLLAFECYLRIGELTSLRVCDIASSSQLHFGTAFTGMCVGLKQTKTGVNQSVLVRESIVETLIDLLLHSYRIVHGHNLSKCTVSLFGYSSHGYRDIFNSYCNMLFPDTHFTPHCIRHGAATRDYLIGININDILIRGRWKSKSSATRYIQSGPMLSLTLNQSNMQKLGAKLWHSKQCLVRAIAGTQLYTQ